MGNVAFCDKIRLGHRKNMGFVDITAVNMKICICYMGCDAV